MNKKNTSGYIAIVFSMLFWGFSFVWTKQLLNNGFPVFTIVFFRLLFASAIFVTFFKLQGKLEKIKKEDFKHFLLLSLFEPFLYFIGENFGLMYVDASFAAVIIALIPIIVSITMRFSEKVPLRWELLLGTLVSVAGIALMTFGKESTIHFSTKGFLILQIALFSAAGYSVLLSRLLKKYSPITITTTQNYMAIFFYLPFVLAFDVRHWGTMAWNGSAIVNLLCLAVFCSAGAYMLYSYAAKQVSITKISVFTNAIPIVTMIVAAIIGQEVFTIQKLVGIVIVVVGVVLSQMKLSK